VGQPTVAIALPDDVEHARAVMTRGRRVARYLGLDWVALRVVRASESDGDDRDLRDLVAALGGRLVLAHGQDIARAILDLSEREHTRVLVIGRSRRPPLLRRIRRGTTEQIVHAKRAFDVLIAAEGVER